MPFFGHVHPFFCKIDPFELEMHQKCVWINWPDMIPCLDKLGAHSVNKWFLFIMNYWSELALFSKSIFFSSVEISDSSERMTMTLDWPNYLLTHLLVMWQLLIMWQLLDTTHPPDTYCSDTLYWTIVNLSIPIYRSINKCTDSFIVVDWLYIGLIHRQNCQNIYLSTYRPNAKKTYSHDLEKKPSDFISE